MMACVKYMMRAAAVALFLHEAGHAGLKFDIEADPIDFIPGEYRLHAGITHDRLRFDLGILKVEIPREIHGYDRFEYRISGVVARIGQSPLGSVSRRMGVLTPASR
jgi:hypothetical protein